MHFRYTLSDFSPVKLFSPFDFVPFLSESYYSTRLDKINNPN